MNRSRPHALPERAGTAKLTFDIHQRRAGYSFSARFAGPGTAVLLMVLINKIILV
ncbi:hypothetical protein [Franconibacter pulveris]|uniref:hypothetical protein n=1 Tax=Franconibacter pulveris TaxID=435910 RepID=UPI000A6BAA9B|nr:hypothetical protein [Franconibacter pulveris]